MKINYSAPVQMEHSIEYDAGEKMIQTGNVFNARSKMVFMQLSVVLSTCS